MALLNKLRTRTNVFQKKKRVRLKGKKNNEWGMVVKKMEEQVDSMKMAVRQTGMQLVRIGHGYWKLVRR
jgi:hypothetical protein